MRTLFSDRRLSRELRQLAKENAAQGKPLSILDDAVFKAMLTSDTEDSREALRCLLSACTRREVSGVQVGINDLVPMHLKAKPSRLDVHVTFNDGESADLEMQIDKSEDNLRDRAAFYTAMLQAMQSRKGHAYKEIKRVYQIFFLNCILYPKSNKLPRRYYYMEEEEHDRLTEISEIIFYEMPKLEQRVRDILAGEADMKSLPEDEKWCMYMRYRHEARAAKLIEKLYGEEEGIMRAEKAIKAIDRDYWRAARKMAEIKDSMDRAQLKYDARQEGRNEGRAEGRAEGMEKGLAEGLSKGHAEGRAETARNLKSLGVSTDLIIKSTGLSPEEIARL